MGSRHGSSISWMLPYIVVPILTLCPNFGQAADCDQAAFLMTQANRMAEPTLKLSMAQEATRLCPDRSDLWMSLAGIEESRGQEDQALEHYQKAATLDPKLIAAHLRRGDLFMKRKDYLQAGRSFMAALKIDPGHQEAARNLQEAEAGLQASGGVLPAEYLATRLDPARLMAGNQNTRERPPVAFQNILFDLNSDRIKPDSQPQLEEIGRALAQVTQDPNFRVVIDGHTDNQGPADYNQGLSLKRAESVRDYLVRLANLDRNRLTVRGHGPQKPVGDNSSEAGRARNRRVEITIESGPR